MAKTKTAKSIKAETKTHINALLDEIDATKELRTVAKKANKNLGEYNKWLAQCRSKIRELEASQ